ncbi:hypothetical protein FACS1894184_05560 [Clostridia bacterium]|nr:hypothetical protein FACS1894184_05560 [Clostridia bacterium]
MGRFTRIVASHKYYNLTYIILRMPRLIHGLHSYIMREAGMCAGVGWDFTEQIPLARSQLLFVVDKPL